MAPATVPGTVRLVWAQAAGGIIGAGGALPWHLPEDLRLFRALTLGSTVVMGRRTWTSLPPRARPLPGRRNVVLSRTLRDAGPEVAVRTSVQQVLDDGGDLWVIGGGEVYAAFLASAHEAVVTEVDAELPGDTWAPALDGDWTAAEQVAGGNWLTSSSGLRYRVTWWRRRAVDGGAGSSEVGAALAGWHAGTGGAQQSGAGAGR